MRDIQLLLDAKMRTSPSETTITVWLDTLGGDAHAAYKLFLELRGRCERLEALVPDCAKSAGTLLLLGVDAIYMGLAAELGPLDAQVVHPEREDLIVSALDVSGTLEQLSQQALDLAIAGGAQALRYTGLPRAAVFRDMLGFASDFLKPAVAKLDLHLVQRAGEQLRVAKRYAKSMLARRNGQARPMAETEADELLQRLVEDYPEHGFVIGRDEALKLGLPIKNAEDHPHWQLAQKLLSVAIADKKTVVAVYTDAELDVRTKVEASDT